MRAALLLLALLELLPRAAWPQGSPVGPEFLVNTYTTNQQTQPSVAADASGNFVVVWESQVDQLRRHIFGQRYASSGAPAGGEFRVNTDPYIPATHSAASVGSDAAGNFVVIWQYQPLAPGGLRGRRFTSSGIPLGGDFMPGSSGYSFLPAVAVDPAGSFVVVWEGLFPGDGSGKAVFGRRYDSSGVPLALFRVNTYTTADQSLASVATDSSGNFVVVWTSDAQDGSGLGIFGQRYDASGAPVGSEFRVNTYTTDNQGRPSVAADSSGDFMVVWQSAAQDGSGDGAFGQRYASSGAPLGPEFLVNTLTTGNQNNPAVAADAAGNFVVTWSSFGQDGSIDGIFGQRYDAAGAPLGPEFRINTNTLGSQSASAVASDLSGDFVVAWQSAGQDGSGDGIVGQRFNMILPVELMHFRVE